MANPTNNWDETDFWAQVPKLLLCRINLVAILCVSSWGYERTNRWNCDAIDPNRIFRADGPALKANALIGLVGDVKSGFLLHVDLHETTGSDESESRPACAACDGIKFQPGPDTGRIYLVDITENPQPKFQ